MLLWGTKRMYVLLVSLDPEGKAAAEPLLALTRVMLGFLLATVRPKRPMLMW